MFAFALQFLLLVLMTQLTIPVYATAVSLDKQLVRVPKNHSVEGDLSWAPVEPTEGTIVIDSKMQSQVTGTGDSSWPFLIDTTTPVSWYIASNISCVDDAYKPDRGYCHLKRTTAHPDVWSAQRTPWPGMGFADQYYGLNYSQRQAVLWGHFVDVIELSPFAGFVLPAQRLLAVDVFQSLPLLHQLDRGFEDFARPQGTECYGAFSFTQGPRNRGDLVGPLINGTGPFLSALQDPGILPILSIAMPRGTDLGVVVVGGIPKNASYTATTGHYAVTSNQYLAPVSHQFLNVVTQTPFYGYAMPVEKFKLSDGKEDKQPTGNYIIDSLSPVIRTHPEFASKIAQTFEPQASIKDGGANLWLVNCSATHPGGIGPMVGEVSFPISKIDMVVKLPSGQCVSAFQPAFEDDAYRLGWPFLMNTVITILLDRYPVWINVTQRVPPP